MALLEFAGKIYTILTRNEAVYLFYLIPIVYFSSIVLRLVYYKVKYRQQLYMRDLMAVGTMVLLVADYVNYLRLFLSHTGQVLPFSAFVIKYLFGFLLWAWMFWYSYQIYLKKSLTKEALKKGRVILLYAGLVFVILLLVAFAVSD